MAQIPTSEMVQNAFSGNVAALPSLLNIDGETIALKAQRRPVALVALILKRTNNFYITGDRGLAAVGIDDPLVLSEYLEPDEGEEFPLDERVKDHNHELLMGVGQTMEDCPACRGLKRNPVYDPSAGVAMVPGIVEVITLLTCSKAELYAFEDDFIHPTKGRPGYLLRERVLEFMEQFDPGQIMTCFAAVDAEFKHIQNSTTKMVEEGKKDLKPGEE
jgi:hypothetical protein